ncbi:MAG: non-ribosomal peptide synthetase, partial [Deltaproteobacteria bacterium]|nr:non-ribosomal peptide synthetase [Deltaproteobacteria bacterium]
ALPLTPNGKVDRKRLPAPFASRIEKVRLEPRTVAEALMASIWRDTLRVEHVGVHDNFFDLGGHSLLSLQVIARVEKETGVQLSPRVLLLNTLEQAAALLPDERPLAASKTVANQPPMSDGLLGRLAKRFLR